MDVIETIWETLDLMRRAGPERFDMNYWFQDPLLDDDSGVGRGSLGLDDYADVDLTGGCGTTGCFAGFLVTAMAPDPREYIGPDWAGAQVGLAPAFFYQAYWPDAMRDRSFEWANLAFRSAWNDDIAECRRFGEWAAICELLEHRLADDNWDRFGAPQPR